MNFNSIKKAILFSLFLLFGNTMVASAASTVTINNYYNLNSGQTCNLSSSSIETCSSFVSDLGGYSFLPVSNNKMNYNSVSYGGESITNFTNNVIGPNAVTQYVGSSVASNVAVAYVPGDITAVSATYLCSGPGGVRQYSVPVTQTNGTVSTFANVDTTAQDCSVTINFNQINTNSGDGDSGSGGTPPPTPPPPPIIDDPFSSISISATPESTTVDYGVATTTYFTVVVNKNGDFPADILVDCERFSIPGNGGGECSFVDNSNNPIPRTQANQPTQPAAFSRYPKYYMNPGLSSVTLRLAVRNYDQYGGVSSVKTHTIPIQAGLLDSPIPIITFNGPQIQSPRCSGSCTAGDTINLVVQNPAICEPTTSVNATSPANANRTFTLSWAPVSNALNYTVEVRDQTSCVSQGCGPVVYSSTVSGTSATIPFGGDVAGVPNKRFGYTVSTNYSPARTACSNIGSVFVSQPTGGSTSTPSGPSGTVNITCNGSQNVTISSGQNCNLAWNSSNIVAGSCNASGNWSGAKAGSGSETKTNITQNSSYTITCRDNNGANVTSTANVTVSNAPTADIKCNGADACTAVRFSSTPNLTWSCTNSSSASVSPGGYTAHPNGAVTVGPFSGSSVTYNLTCTSATGATATDSVTINVVNNPAPGTPAYKVDLYPDPLTFNVEKGGSWSGSATITNIGDTTLNISAFIDNVVSNFGGWYSQINPSLVCPNLLPSTFYTCSVGFGGHTINVDQFTTNTFDLNFTEPTAGNRLDIPVTVNVGGRPSCPTASVSLSSNTVDVGSSVTASAPNSDLSNCTYSTSNASVASLSGNPRNVVNGVSVGTSNISAQCDFMSNWRCNVNPATLNVVNPSAPSPTTYSFSVAPTSLSFSAIQNAAAPASKTVTVTNTGTGALNITRTQNMTSGPFNWGSSDSSSFSLAVGASRVVTVSINSTAGDPGNYDGTVTFTDTNAGAKQVPVALVLAPSSSTRTIDVGTNWCGTVTSSPAGISCGTTCNAGFTYNNTVTLTATPNTQCLFIGWLGDCAGQDATCDLLMTSNKSATPIFGLKPFNYEEF